MNKTDPGTTMAASVLFALAPEAFMNTGCPCPDGIHPDNWRGYTQRERDRILAEKKKIQEEIAAKYRAERAARKEAAWNKRNKGK